MAPASAIIRAASGASDFQKPYLRRWLNFIGITDIQEINVTPTLTDTETLMATKCKATGTAIGIAPGVLTRNDPAGCAKKLVHASTSMSGIFSIIVKLFPLVLSLSKDSSKFLIACQVIAPAPVAAKFRHGMIVITSQAE
ncbi:MAG: hypothetical protein ACREQV_01940 [Candidatus Binatia bacterium]